MNKKVFLILSCAVLCLVGCRQKSTNSETQTVNTQEVIMNDTTMTLCQSCGMPLNEEIFAKNADGSTNKEYCKWCFVDGQMQNPEATMSEMIEICVPHLVEQGMSEDDARAMMEKLLPTLKRWKTE
jgi:hypothetical protein